MTKTQSLPSTVYNAASCSATNVLKSLVYRVFYTEDRLVGNYKVQAISVDLLLLDSLILDPKYCQAQPSKSFFSFSQSFGIEFVVAGLSQTEFSVDAMAAIGTQSRSGNPGYRSFQPLLISKGTDENGSEQVEVNGTFLQAGDLSGACIAQTTMLNNFQSERVDFDKFITMSCSVSFATLQDFKTYCESGKAASLRIFAQLSQKAQKIGTFGNASTHNTRDWVSVIDLTQGDGYFNGVFNPENNSCTLKASL